MKFSFQLFKKLVPQIKSPRELADILTMHLFEVESIEGDTLDVKVLANRYSDAASHWGIARVVSAVLGRKGTWEMGQGTREKAKAKSKFFEIQVKNKNLCPRYSARYFELKKVGGSPGWMQNILKSCGIRPINAVVDIMNYVMLEVGQPMHAFDFDKIEGSKILVRLTQRGEKVAALDGNTYELTENDLVIADSKNPLAIAGIKGGRKAEVGGATRRIIVESATFDPATIYKTSRRLNLKTDASLRFSHGLSPVLAEWGIARARELLKEICGVKSGDWLDVQNIKPRKVVLKFDAARFQKLTGLELPEKVRLDYLKRLGFEVKGKLVSPPPERTDIAIFEDLVEEIMALHGYDKVPITPPHVPLRVPVDETNVHFKERLRRILPGLGLTEVYNYSFAPKGEVEIENPTAEDRRFLRRDLSYHFAKNIEDNLRFFDEVRIFELGEVFSRSGEALKIGIALGSRKDSFVLELKGIVETLCSRLGVPELVMTPFEHNRLAIFSNSAEIGSIRVLRGKDAAVSIAELDAEALRESLASEKAFSPLPKFPSVVRDLSVVVSRKTRTGDILEAIEDVSPLIREPIEIVDFYEGPSIGEDNQSLTFRFKFRLEDRTLTDTEVNSEMGKITALLATRFHARVR